MSIRRHTHRNPNGPSNRRTGRRSMQSDITNFALTPATPAYDRVLAWYGRIT